MKMDPRDQLKPHRILLRNISMQEIDSADWNDNTLLQPLPPVKDSTLDSDDKRYLREVYSRLLEIENHEHIEIPPTIAKFKSVRIGTVVYESLESRTTCNAHVLGNWPGTEGSLNDTNDSELRSGLVEYYFKHHIKIASLNASFPIRSYDLFMASANWYSKHPDRFAYGLLNEVYCKHFDSFGPACFIPIQRIKARYFHGRKTQEKA